MRSPRLESNAVAKVKLDLSRSPFFAAGQNFARTTKTRRVADPQLVPLIAATIVGKIINTLGIISRWPVSPNPRLDKAPVYCRKAWTASQAEGHNVGGRAVGRPQSNGIMLPKGTFHRSTSS